MTKTLILLVSLAALMVSCTSQTGSRQENPDNSTVSGNFSVMLDEYYLEFLELNPLVATMFGIEGYKHLFTNPLSDEHRANLKAFYTSYLAQVNSFEDEELSESQQVSKAIILWECERGLEQLHYRTDLLPLDQTWSVNFEMGQYASGKGAQAFNTVEDYQDWLKRLKGYLEWMAMVEEKMREGMELGYVLPRSLILKIPPTLEPFTTEDPDQQLFYRPIKNMPDSFSAEEKRLLTEMYREIIFEEVVPAYKRLHQFVSNEYLEAGRESSGIDGIPHGSALYTHLVKTQTTTEMTTDEIFQVGLDEVARIRREMEGVKKELGFRGDIKDFFDYVRHNQELMPYEDPQEVIDHFNAIHERMKPQLEQLFDLKPKIDFEVRRTEAFREQSTGPHYKPGADDGSRPGIFYVSIPNVKKYNNASDESLFLHEAIPGHHYQISLTQENKDLPDFRKYLWFNAYGEGWALYTESLGKELGLYTDPYQYFGNLSSEMHRAIRLVVDVGLHAKGWTREKAIQYCLENEAESEDAIISEVERYMAFPAQALGYKIGQLKISELRARAEQELGNRFDIREFHNILLGTGCVPLTTLEQLVDKWIQDQNQST